MNFISWCIKTFNTPFKIGLAVVLVVLPLSAAIILKLAVESNSSQSSNQSPELTESSRQALRELPFCSVAKHYGVPGKVIAGIYLSENQIHHDWTDEVQNTLFRTMLSIFSEPWWQQWSDRSFSAANQELALRTKSSQWSKAVTWSGIIFSLGPSQITMRTALNACEFAPNKPMWCQQGTKRLVQAVLDQTESLEVAALILDNERQAHLKETGVDFGSSAGKWSTLYNFGGDIFRARFKDNPDRAPNAYGRWVENNINEIDSILSCDQAL